MKKKVKVLFIEVLRVFKNGVSKSNYDKDKFINGISEDDINNMEKTFNKIYNIHKEKYNTIIDNKGNELVYYNKFDYDSQSKLYKDKLIENINNSYNLLNKSSEEMHIRILFNFSKNNKKFDEDRTKKVNLLCEDIENININEKDKEEIKNKLFYLFNEFDKL
ncbi:hypothetical protein BCR36DRAFT_453917 [Piromyces finnis]|uniref:Uncharacterized protein n=1 Tax=Piromyces finnis TaxID=1754191 RepID=A0A1Y1VLB2_9FUNG|nr:hypothetical protein BCR36DRAFT_453917 [Piromyces finnis]|eukprot:ORX59257.1 hypothetical protein BCR36DRAFT_453917 [Piromyces finnis]